VNCREHNNANVLTLGSKMIGETVAEHIVKVFLKTDFAGGRHQGRIDKMMAVEKKR
ncbi:MAG TPA: RpiB/LacA/LacB family sugar-phosphate isomerase, partial [bacterium]|nr:RpiB/LacA/LacB family sugar-phosphate isomerase [bacterium]